MRSAINTGFNRIVCSVVILMAGMMLVTCDDNNKDNNKQRQELFLINGSRTKLVLYDAGMNNGNLKGAEADARTGADALCNSSSNKPTDATNIHAFITITDTDEIRDMPGNYGYPTDAAIYGPNGRSLLAKNWADILDGTINMTLEAAGVITDDAWWSGCFFSGEIRSTCLNFTSDAGGEPGTEGERGYTNATWISNYDSVCSQPRHVLCIGEE